MAIRRRRLARHAGGGSRMDKFKRFQGMLQSGGSMIAPMLKPVAANQELSQSLPSAPAPVGYKDEAESSWRSVEEEALKAASSCYNEGQG